MVGCSVKGCGNRSDRNAKLLGLSFHNFPQNGVRKKNWAAAIGREGWVPGRHAQVCSAHFKLSDFRNSVISCLKNKTLKATAIPSLHPASSPEEDEVKKEEIVEASVSSPTSANSSQELDDNVGHCEGQNDEPEIQLAETVQVVEVSSDLAPSYVSSSAGSSSETYAEKMLRRQLWASRLKVKQLTATSNSRKKKIEELKLKNKELKEIIFQLLLEFNCNEETTPSKYSIYVDDNQVETTE